MASEYDTKKLVLDEFANAVVQFQSVSRLTKTSYVRIEQAMCNELSKIHSSLPHIFFTGSFYEAMPLDFCGDMDLMFNMQTFPVVLFDSVDSINQHTGGYVKAEQNPEEPSYLNLKAVDKDSLDSEVRHIVDKDGYLKTTEFIEFNMNIFTNDGNSMIGYFFKRHGPSLGVDTEMNTSKLDEVFSFKCQQWPSITTSFFTRQRPANWPSQELLNKLSRLECLVVPVGHPNSSEMKPEWRLSFSLAEKELIHHMQESFFNCMCALKALKNKYIVYSESDKPTPFCSYFIKTACLWLCEEYSDEGYSIMDLIRKTIDWLIDCYRRRNLPSYFISEQNLISHLSQEHCDDVITKLTTVKKDLWKMVVSSAPLPSFVRELVIHPLCDKLNITKINEGDDYTALETSLIKHSQRSDVLKTAIKDIMPGGYLHIFYGSVTNSEWPGRHFRYFSLLIEELKLQVETSYLVSYLEKIFQLIVRKIDEIVFGDNDELFKQGLYRYLGDLCTYLLIYSRNAGGARLQSTCYSKPLHYYELATAIQHTEKWSDCGMAGQVSLVTHHYLMENYKDLKEKLENLTPTLHNIKEDYLSMNRQINIEIPKESSFVIDAWATDKLLQHFAKTSNGELFVNPVVFVFYVNARVSLLEGDIQNARLAVKEIEKCLKVICIDKIIFSTNSLIKIIQSLIGLLEIARLQFKSSKIYRSSAK